MEMEDKAVGKLGSFNAFLLNKHNEHMHAATPYCYQFRPRWRRKVVLWLAHQTLCRLRMSPHKFNQKIDDVHFPQYQYEALREEFARRQQVQEQ